MKKALIFLSLLTLPLTLLPTPSTANAVTAADWKPGRIIDDFIFTNKSAMTVAQIQQFLDAKLTTCDTKGVQQITYRYSTTTKRIGQSGDPYVTTSRALYAYRYHMYVRLYRENPDPSYPLPPVATTKPESIPDAEDVWYTTNTNMVCLKNYYENTTTKATNYGSGVIPSGAISAAQIIWDASQRYNISPQVLLVTLQKEQNLIGDDWPWPYQIRAATGYACSDSAPCEAQYYGLFNQIENAAWQFNNYMVNPQFFIYRAGVTRFISYQANNPGCGGTNVFIENAATAALYNYTPYQPNQASLNNLYGTGDGCSAYGNRNFWRLFSDWFGSTLYFGVPYPHPDGTLVRNRNELAVYIISEGTRRQIQTATSLFSHGYNFGDVLFSNYYDDSLPIGEPYPIFKEGSLVKGSTNHIYVIDYIDNVAHKRLISSWDIFIGLGYDFKEVTTVNNSELPTNNYTPINSVAIHPDGTLVIDPRDNRVYRIEDEKIRPFISQEIFLSYRNSFSRVKNATPSDLIKPIGETIPFKEGVLVKSGTMPHIYAINHTLSGQERKLITSWYCFVDMGYIFEKNVVIVPDWQVSQAPQKNHAC